MNNIYVVTLGISYEAPANQWIFFDEPSARVRFDEVAGALKARELAEGDYVLLEGPFSSGDSILRSKGKRIAYSE